MGGWNSLPQTYLDSPYLNCDTTALEFSEPYHVSLEDSEPAENTHIFPLDEINN